MCHDRMSLNVCLLGSVIETVSHVLMHWKGQLIQGEQEHLNRTTHGVVHFVFRQSGRTAFTLYTLMLDRWSRA